MAITPLSLLAGCASGAGGEISPTSADPVAVEERVERVSFAVIGDFGASTEAEAAVAAMVNSWNPDFVATLGDNNYPNGEAHTLDPNVGRFYSRYIHPYKGSFTPPEGTTAERNRFFPALGNHDWRTPGVTPHIDYFELPGNERYYTYRRGPVELFVVDSDRHEPDGVTPDSIQGAWLQAALADSDAPFKVVTMHHPPYSSGRHGSQERMRWPFFEWGADLVLAGHDHTYERLVIDGDPYVVNGLGGSYPYHFEETEGGSEVRFVAVPAATRVDADSDWMVVESLTVTGGVIDSFRLPVDGGFGGELEELTLELEGDGALPLTTNDRATLSARATLPESGGSHLLLAVEISGGLLVTANGEEVWRFNLPLGELEQGSTALQLPAESSRVQQILDLDGVDRSQPLDISLTLVGGSAEQAANLAGVTLSMVTPAP